MLGIQATWRDLRQDSSTYDLPRCPSALQRAWQACGSSACEDMYIIDDIDMTTYVYLTDTHTQSQDMFIYIHNMYIYIHIYIEYISQYLPMVKRVELWWPLFDVCKGTADAVFFGNSPREACSNVAFCWWWWCFLAFPKLRDKSSCSHDGSLLRCISFCLITNPWW